MLKLLHFFFVYFHISYAIKVYVNDFSETNIDNGLSSSSSHGNTTLIDQYRHR